MKMHWLLLISALILAIQVKAADPNPSQKQPDATKSPALDFTKFVSPEGITIPQDSTGMPKGAYGAEAFPGQVTTISLAGKSVRALIECSGNGSFSDDGKLAVGTKAFKPHRIMTSKANEKWIKIISFSIGKSGALRVVAEGGDAYEIRFGPSFNGSIEEAKSEG